MALEQAKSPELARYGSPLDGAWLLYQLAIRGWSKGELAKRAKIANSTVTQACASQPITGTVAQKIADALQREPAKPELIELVANPRARQELSA